MTPIKEIGSGADTEIFLGDMIFFINICKATHEKDWGISVDGVGNPLLIVENSKTGTQIGFFKDLNDNIVSYHCPDANAIDKYINESALNQFNNITAQKVDTNYIVELITGALSRDPSDFEFENKLKTILIEGSNENQKNSLKIGSSCYGIWVLFKEQITIKINLHKKIMLFNEKNMYGNFDDLFEDLFGNSEQTVLLIKN